MTAAALADLADTSNQCLHHLGPTIQWVHSYVTDDQPPASTWPTTIS